MAKYRGTVPMQKYRVTVVVSGEFEIEVYADNEDEARDSAEQGIADEVSSGKINIYELYVVAQETEKI